ncbi:MAG: homoserine kinase [Proteobacteria bacterium]|nr:homoserine kinase [Pseudomonadota bacterium]
MKVIKAFAPATIANFVVGFDSLGASFAVEDDLFGDIVTIESASQSAFKIIGKYASVLQAVEENVVTQATQLFHQKLISRNIKPSTLDIQLEKRLPISSGLGSSASSIVAALIALNAFYDNVFLSQDLLSMAGDLEGRLCGAIHFDNVAPSMFGGLQLLVPDKLSESLPWFDDWVIVIIYPGVAVTTKMARELLPTSLTLPKAVNYWQKFSVFIHALYKNDPTLALAMMKDSLIEPLRATLIPQFELLRSKAIGAGALSFGISGSGPTCFAIADSLLVAQNIYHAINDVKLSPESFCKIGKISKQGARIIE